jgi:HflK protein
MLDFVTDFLEQIITATWSIFAEAAPFLLAGFVLAGALAVLMPSGALQRHLGRGNIRSVLWASALGAPLPLCSCGVLPTALALRKQGATEGATVAFLVATPETGIDQLALSYSLTDPLLTAARPIAGILSAIAAGIATNFLGPLVRRQPPVTAAGLHCEATESGDNPCMEDHESTYSHGHVHQHPEVIARGTPLPPGEVDVQPIIIRIADIGRRVFRYAFRDMLDDTSHWLVLGFVLTGIIAPVLPADTIEYVLGGGTFSMLAMVLVAIPVYTCAASSTPLAAMLVLKGLSPGAALVFLLTGPATNISSLVVLLRFLGARIVAIYLGATIAMAILAGNVVNAIYRQLAISPQATFGSGTDFVPTPIKLTSAVILLTLIVVSLRRTPLPEEWRWVGSRIAGVTGLQVRWRYCVSLGLAAALLLYAASSFFEVGPGQVGLRFRFGRPVASDLAPGLHVRLPWPIESHRIVALHRERRIVFGVRAQPSVDAELRVPPRQSPMFGAAPPPASGGVMFRKEAQGAETFFLTGDGNMIDLRFALHWRVADAASFVLRMREPEPLIESLALAALREAAATSGIDAIYTTAREALEQRVVRSVQAALDRYGAGIEITSVHLLYDHPPDEVHDSFRDVASAQEDKQRTINRAQTFSIEKINQSRGDVAAMLAEAQGYKEERIARATGEAAAFRARLDAYREAPQVAEFRLRIEAAEAALPGARKLLTPGAQATGALDLWLNQPFSSSGKH